jgi:hypothetical protein
MGLKGYGSWVNLIQPAAPHREEVRHVHGGALQREEAADGGVSDQNAQHDVERYGPPHL